MIKIRILIIALLISLIVAPVAALASDISDAQYYGTITITNNSTAATNVSTNLTLDTQELIDGFYLNSTANNTVIRNSSGADVPFMPGYSGNEWIMWVPSIGADSQLTYILYTANSSGGEIRYFPGTAGMTTADNASMEFSTNFTIEHSGYVNTSAYTIGAPSVPDENGGNDVVNQLNHTVNLPAGIEAGNLLIVIFATDSNPAVTFPAGWTVLDDAVIPTGALRFVIYYRIADGTEGASITVTTANIQMTAHTSFRIINYQGLPEIGVIATSADANPNPPNLTPSWGAKDTLWLAITGYDTGTVTVNAYPASYSAGRNDRSNHAEGVGVGAARRRINAASQNPGTFTLSAGPWWGANTIAIQGAQKNLVYKDSAFEAFVDSVGSITARIFGGAVPSVTASGIASGEHTVTISGDAVSGFQISVDGTLEDSTQLPFAAGNAWAQAAPQLVEIEIYSLVVYNNQLYGGTGVNGNLYRWNDVNAWVQVAPQLNAQSEILDLAVYNNKLYGSTGVGGRLFEWNDVNAWVEVAPQLGAETRIRSLEVYNGKLYGGTNPNGKLYEWNDVNLWVEVAPQLGAEVSIYSLAVYNNRLYGGTGLNGLLYRWNDVNLWVEVAPQLNAQTTILDLAVYNSRLYGSTGATGRLFEWNDVNAWVEVAPQLNGQTHIRSLEVYNSRLYGSTRAGGRLFEWNDVNAWIQVAPQLGAEIDIYALAVYSEQLYGGTSPNGNLYQWNMVISGVPDNANIWTFLQNDVIPYMVTQNVTVGGSLVQDIEWEYDSVFTDQSGNSNDATPTFRTASSDTDVSAALVSFLPITEAQAPAYTLGEAPPFISSTANITGNFTITPPAGTFPLAGVITAVADATSTPPQLPLLIIALFVILTASFSVSAVMRRYGSGSVIVKILAIAAVMGIFIALVNFGIDFWMLVVFLIISIAMAMASKQLGWT